MVIKILLADDHKIVREGLREVLIRQEDMDVIASVDNGWEAIEKAAEFSPDVVLMDISMPDLNGIDATRKLLQENEKIKIIALSMHSDKKVIFEMLHAGSVGFLQKDCDFSELFTAIRTVVRNKVYISPSVAGTMVDDYLTNLPAEKQSNLVRLSQREREVLQLLAEGSATKEIAHKLFLSVKTIETHRLNIMKKLNLHSIADLTKFAIREGITSV